MRLYSETDWSCHTPCYSKSDSKLNMDKKALKKLKNREAAARCRNRRKQLIDDLTDLSEKLEAEKAKIANEVCMQYVRRRACS